MACPDVYELVSVPHICSVTARCMGKSIPHCWAAFNFVKWRVSCFNSGSTSRSCPNRKNMFWAVPIFHFSNFSVQWNPLRITKATISDVDKLSCPNCWHVLSKEMNITVWIFCMWKYNLNHFKVMLKLCRTKNSTLAKCFNVREWNEFVANCLFMYPKISQKAMRSLSKSPAWTEKQAIRMAQKNLGA